MYESRSLQRSVIPHFLSEDDGDGPDSSPVEHGEWHRAHGRHAIRVDQSDDIALRWISGLLL